MDFHLTIDFADDLWFAQVPWTEEHLRQLVRGYARRGIKAIHWIDVGARDDGLFDQGGYLDRFGQAWEFIQRVPQPLQIVADEAHRQSLPCYSVFKIFDYVGDMPWASYPLGQGPQPPVGLPHLGGIGNWSLKWFREHPTLRAELHPALQERLPRRPLATIRLWHENVNLPTGQVQLLVSDDNRLYRPYDGPLTLRLDVRRRRPPRFVPAPQTAFEPEGEFACIEFTGLDLPQPFVAVTFDGVPLANTLAALVEMADITGQSVAFTFGLIPRLTPENRAPDWRQVGIAFDAAYNTPINGRGWKLTRSGGAERVEPGTSGFLGLARGRNNHLSGMTELAYPQARAWAVGVVRRALDDGCDGVEIRTTTHTENLDWENYGFSPPILDEYRRRYGTDPATQPFDRAQWRQVRGEFFDAFLWEASTLAHGRGKQLSAQIYNDFDAPVEVACMHEIAFLWRDWVDHRLVDRISFVNTYLREPLYHHAVEFCRRRQMPRVLTPSMFAADDTIWQGDGKILIETALADGFDAFNIYESAAVCRLESAGFSYRCPSLWKMIEHHSATG